MCGIGWELGMTILNRISVQVFVSLVVVQYSNGIFF